MGVELKPIETIYDGYRFRSRLEARWAVFFNAAGIRYQYEPEGFVGLWGERYLPDFYLPDFDIYAEVKPNKEKLLDDASKISGCIDWQATEISRTGLLLLGQIPYWDGLWYELDESGKYIGYCIPHFIGLFWAEGIVTKSVCFWMAPQDRVVKFLTVGPGAMSYSAGPELPDMDAVNDDLWSLNSEVYNHGHRVLLDHESPGLLRNMFLKARQARFEHGEKPI